MNQTTLRWNPALAHCTQRAHNKDYRPTVGARERSDVLRRASNSTQQQQQIGLSALQSSHCLLALASEPALASLVSLPSYMHSLMHELYFNISAVNISAPEAREFVPLSSSLRSNPRLLVR